MGILIVRRRLSVEVLDQGRKVGAIRDSTATRMRLGRWRPPPLSRVSHPR